MSGWRARRRLAACWPVRSKLQAPCLRFRPGKERWSGSWQARSSEEREGRTTHSDRVGPVPHLPLSMTQRQHDGDLACSNIDPFPAAKEVSLKLLGRAAKSSSYPYRARNT